VRLFKYANCGRTSQAGLSPAFSGGRCRRPGAGSTRAFVDRDRRCAAPPINGIHARELHDRFDPPAVSCRAMASATFRWCRPKRQNRVRARAKALATALSVGPALCRDEGIASDSTGGRPPCHERDRPVPYPLSRPDVPPGARARRSLSAKRTAEGRLGAATRFQEFAWRTRDLACALLGARGRAPATESAARASSRRIASVSAETTQDRKASVRSTAARTFHRPSALGVSESRPPGLPLLVSRPRKVDTLGCGGLRTPWLGTGKARAFFGLKNSKRRTVTGLAEN
jgi:hypothetical protein